MEQGKVDGLFKIGTPWNGQLGSSFVFQIRHHMMDYKHLEHLSVPLAGLI